MPAETGSPGIVPEPGTAVESGKHWSILLNRNQNLLGKTMLVANRPVQAVTDLTEEEWADLHDQIRRVTQALTRAFQPDHFNYAFLQNLDRRVHLHVIPRYASPRTFATLIFDDPDYPGHYAVPSPVRRLSFDQRHALSATLRQLLDDR